MNRLIWKELREIRLIPLAIPLLVVVALLVCDASSNWMAAHIGTSWVPMRLVDCPIFLIFGLAAPGLFAGSGAIAPETGSGTLAFLTSLPTGRPRLWTAKVIAGLTVMAASALTVTLSYLVTVSLLFPGESAIKGISGSDGAVAVFVLAAYVYCVALLVSTLVDRTITAAVVAVIASVGAGCGLMSLIGVLSDLDEHDPHVVLTGITLYGLGFLGLLTASFTAFCQGDSLRTRRRLVIAGVVLSAWFTTWGLGFAAYGNNVRQHWERAQQLRSLAAGNANEAEYRRFTTTVEAPAGHGQHWTILVDNALINTGFRICTIDIGANDLDVAGAVPVKAMADRGIAPEILPAGGRFGKGRWRPTEYYRGSPIVTVMQYPGGHLGVSRPIVPGPTIARVVVGCGAQPPLGSDHQTVRLVDKLGRVVGAIDIVVRSKSVYVDHFQEARQ
jgi:hypothetical protein